MPLSLLGFIVLLLAILMVVGIVAGLVVKADPYRHYWWAVTLVCVALLVLILLFSKGNLNGALVGVPVATTALARAAYQLG
jgi:VIT1/CCC1 family predicted Fe2+/Mn2+ transporter